MGKSVLKDKSYQFALKIVKTAQVLQKNNEFVLSKQVLRSGTSIGANVREAEFAQSKKDFIHKMSISLKEANETDYWINLLNDSEQINKTTFTELQGTCKELIAMLVSTVKTAKT